MKPRYSKPSVFLSHSKKNIDFIEKLYGDLRRCQIEPWLDSEEIRHGKPWLDSIFESGLPKCDSVLIYLTEESLESMMVKKEIDAGILQQLNDSGVSLLPYVINEDVRMRLRSDIRALQVPVWNSNNYYIMLPVVVAEIWRNFLERVVNSTVAMEQNSRLKAELELEKFKNINTNNNIFTNSEEADFNYIWSKLDIYEEIGLILKKINLGNDENTEREISTLNIHIGSIITQISSGGTFVFNEYDIDALVKDTLREKGYMKEVKEKHSHYFIRNMPNITDKLTIFGLVEKRYIEMKDTNSRLSIFLGRDNNQKIVFSNKLERFKYWLAVNDKLPSDIMVNEI